jgi:hypothetical protein
MSSVIKINFSVQNILKNKVDDIVFGMIRTFIYVGEACVKRARRRGSKKSASNGSYMDQTGNLRASVGYVVLYNGTVQGKSNIAAEGQKLIEELMPKYRTGLILIVVAGMNYAAHVEARNYDVLTSAELKAEELIPKMLKKIGFTQ